MRDRDRQQPQDFQQGAGISPLPGLRSTSDTESMGDIHFSSESFSLAIEYFEQAYKQTQDIGREADAWRLSFKLGESYRRKGLLNEAREWFYLAKSRLKGSEESVEYGLVLDHIGAVLAKSGQPEEGLKYCFRAYELLKNTSLHRELADTLNRIAVIYSRLGYPEEAEEFFTDALVTYRRVGNHVGMVGSLMNLGLVKKNACEFDQALALFEKSLNQARKHSLQDVQISLLLNCGIVYFKQGRHREAAEKLTRARKLAREAGDEAKTTRATISLGRVQICLGNLRRAEHLLLAGKVLAEKNSLQRSVVLADEFLGELSETKGDLEAAMANYEVALDQARIMAPKGDIVVEVMQRIARVKLAQGLPVDAIRIAEKTIKLIESNGEFYELPFIYLTQARARVRLQEIEKGDVAFQNSLQAFNRTGIARERAKVLGEYADFLFSQVSLENVLRAKKIIDDLLVNSVDDADDLFLYQCNLLLARIEDWLGNVDRALLAIFDAEGYLPQNATTEQIGDLHEIRNQIEQRKISFSRDNFGFLPGQRDLSLTVGGREDLPEDLRRAWHSLFELCEADAGCLCMDGLDGQAFEFLEGMNRRDLAQIKDNPPQDTRTDETGEDDLGEEPTFLYQPLSYSDKEVGFLCLWRKGPDNGFSAEMVRYLAGFARMVTLIAFRDQHLQLRKSLVQHDLPEAAQDIITQDPAMLELLHLAGRVAESPAWVLLSGETGTGKGVLAYAIHRMSERRDKHFIHVNCAALPEELLESELFGHIKGSFTGAVADKPGLLEAASGGTLFLDEVGKTSLKMQAKLLQFLDTREIRRVGSNHSIPVNVRLITATKTNLKSLCQRGLFLEDLYYRLNDFPLHIPPLRERRGDIGMLSEYFLERYAPDFLKDMEGLSAAALNKLETYSWPGNIRELEKVIKRALLLTQDKKKLGAECVVLDDHLQLGLQSKEPQNLNLRAQMGDLEKQLIREALEHSQGNKSQAAKLLGVSYPTILQKIKRYNLGN